MQQPDNHLYLRLNFDNSTVQFTLHNMSNNFTLVSLQGSILVRRVMLQSGILSHSISFGFGTVFFLISGLHFFGFRYPDDPFDRIWESDSVKKANYLVDVAAGTEKISTDAPIFVNRDEMPPMKVMQTAVVGTAGSLTYRLNLDGFPGNAWAVTYFAEIEDLRPNESRKFRLVLPGQADLSKAIVNIEENALGKYRLYEPGFINLTLPFVLSFKFGKTSDSSKGPLINAMEINKYLEKNEGSPDGKSLNEKLNLILFG
jgi:hypothetical protein